MRDETQREKRVELRERSESETERSGERCREIEGDREMETDSPVD